jgi:hypothetical protein
MDTVNLEINDGDEIFIDKIIELLVKNNGLTCPYKNYGSENHCPNAKNCGENNWDIDCNQETKKVWKDFIRIKD